MSYRSLLILPTKESTLKRCLVTSWQGKLQRNFLRSRLELTLELRLFRDRPSKAEMGGDWVKWVDDSQFQLAYRLGTGREQRLLGELLTENY